MGAWGPGLFQNDTVEDLKYDYKSQLKLGKSDEEALEYVLEVNDTENLDDDEKYDFWLALASLMHDLGRLTEDVKKRALELAENPGYDLERWSKKERPKREQVIFELKEKLNSPQPPRKKISVSRPFKCKWNVNDVFYYKLGSEYADTPYEGKYILILVENFERYDARIRGLGDVLPVTILKLSDNIPENVDEINSAPIILHFIKYVPIDKTENGKTVREYERRRHARVMWYSFNFSAFEKKLTYLGSFDFERPDNNKYAPYPITGDRAEIADLPANFERVIHEALDKNHISSMTERF
ncbi:MAG: DUF4259 domain-containing protein [Oscillospiraceae bacterium]|nr:DUF4259 domain-containing protein [Oscillospiraceae bacterium]